MSCTGMRNLVMVSKGKGRRYSRLLFAGTVAVLCLVLWRGSTATLEPWHTEKLSMEFTAKDRESVLTFAAYRQLEERLFAQLEQKVYLPANIGKGFELVRYSTGSLADPRNQEPDWNRSFELGAASPAGSILLLHGMSDSPYSLRALGQAFNRRGYHVVGLRLPGHGTAPSGLTGIDWEDMAAAVRVAVSHLGSKTGQKPLHIVGYSTGASLAMDYTLDALAGKAAPVPASLVLISPAIGVHPAARLAGVKDWFSIVPGLAHLAWISIQPEFDPYKYNSFATNAGAQVHRITSSVAKRIKNWSLQDRTEVFPPILIFKSAVDATVSTNAVVDSLLNPLADQNHELVLFDINRFAANTSLLVADPGPLTSRLLAEESLPFILSLVGNREPESMDVVVRRKAPQATAPLETRELGLAWPRGVISLSHVALPFPPDDPLYGQQRPDNRDSLYLGQMAIKGERGLLKIPDDWLLRLRYNPFYGFLEHRAIAWVEKANEG